MLVLCTHLKHVSYVADECAGYWRRIHPLASSVLDLGKLTGSHSKTSFSCLCCQTAQVAAVLTARARAPAG
jgi:hypothetical protein